MTPTNSNLVDSNENQASLNQKLTLLNTLNTEIAQIAEIAAKSVLVTSELADEIIKSNNRLIFEGTENARGAAELLITSAEKAKLAAQLVIASTEKARRIADLIVANAEKNERAAELVLANQELKLEANEKEKRVSELAAAKEDALYDHLTKLPNRKLFSDRFNQALLASRRSKGYSAILFLDLDKFKLVNDSYSHEVGDSLLIEIADRIKKSIRDTDTVARFGGDEFVVLLTQLNQDKKIANSEAALISEKIRSSVEIPVTTDHMGVKVVIQPQCTASIGVTLFLYVLGEPSAILKKILNQADNGMYQAKKAGGNQIQFDDTVK
ncbi:GGDEF domain-containing protein [Polynucleobacter sp. CS-Odin-A6]|uniref:GGDEF domain-containing protein n=1 Tax=Polynucleobacter sp. CS-Odin-A6 TaxID=2689106 RepID=UPI001C0CF55F|nr:GGDEF domain-containing protein [Polynucleobacter sp. CS-Odin-A6]MBU3621733.1 diguanylate cyclase [Polynucleobacter sp. CS-Odin-A6]